jgi:hypothetical protein
MTNNQNPATPAPAATPGNVPAVDPTSSVTTPAPTGDQGGTSDGKVSIDLKEYRDLQRAKARTLSFDKRVKIQSSRQANGQDPQDDDQVTEQIRNLESQKSEAERKVLQMEVRDKVRNLLDQDEFKVLPKSTKDLILKNPAMLSDADNLEEAMLDIEDFCREKAQEAESSTQVQNGGNKPEIKNDVPPVVNSGSPAPVAAVGLEDLSKLSGPARSQAAIRNKLKEARGIK